jgi:hypothetical protein
MADSCSLVESGKKGKMLHRLDRSIMVLATKDNHQAAVPIPAGTIVDVWGSLEDDRFVVVSIDGQQFLAFASDVANGAERITTAGT